MGSYPEFELIRTVNIGSVSFTDVSQLLWTPVEMGGACAPTGVDCSWQLGQFTPVVAIESVRTVARASQRVALDEELDELLSQGMVISSLDIATNEYAAIGIAPVGDDDTYVSSESIDLPIGQLQSWAAAEGMNGAVVTAVSANADTIRAMSFSRTGDQMTYEVQVADATVATLEAEVTTLAQDGYVLTAFGQTGTGTFALVGTRTSGATAPRSLRYRRVPQGTAPGDAIERELRDGYAIVGLVFDGTAVGDDPRTHIIAER